MVQPAFYIVDTGSFIKLVWHSNPIMRDKRWQNSDYRSSSSCNMCDYQNHTEMGKGVTFHEERLKASRPVALYWDMISKSCMGGGTYFSSKRLQAITIALNVCNAVLCPAIISKCTQDPHSPIYITELFLWLDKNNQPLTLFTLA